MMHSFADNCNIIFDKCIEDYHKYDNVDTVISNPYPANSIDSILYAKNWIDVVQWHLEDIIRDPEIDPKYALSIKRRIDRSNQDRTDIVERLDISFLEKYKSIKPREDATINTETPAWALDRLSILALKIYHMREQVCRKDANDAHIENCRAKLDVLLEQRKDLSESINILLDDISAGRKVMKLYRQMKLYNDPATNPILYSKK